MQPAPTNQGSTAKAAIDRISDVYRDRTRTSGGKLANSGSTNKGKTNNQAGGGELPNVATVARFAIERERLAREMGMEELGGPATLGVVNVGAAVAHGRRQNYHNLNGQGGGSGNKRPRNYHRGAGRGRPVDYSSGGGRRIGISENFSESDAALFLPGAEAVTERRSAGEMLLEKLESVAEARSIESAGCLRGGGDRAEEDHPSHRNSHTEGEPSFFNDPAGERGATTEGGGALGAAPRLVGGELSTTESAFLERSRRLGSLDGGEGGKGGEGGDSLFGHHFEAGFQDESSVSDGRGTGGDGGGGGHIATIGALRDRLVTLEGENTALRARARRAEEERAAEAARGDRASKKLAQVCVGDQRAWGCTCQAYRCSFFCDSREYTSQKKRSYRGCYCLKTLVYFRRALRWFAIVLSWPAVMCRWL